MKEKPNVVLISLDTVRADHLSCYGYVRNTTPNLDRLAEEGILFEEAYSTAAWTPPAHASMLTGLYPSEHGAVDDRPLPVTIPTLAETLKNHGYRTAGIVNNSQVGQLVGLEKGHDSFEEVWRGRSSPNLALRGLRFLERKAEEAIGIKDHGARRTNRLARGWLESVSQSAEPFYLFLHYIDVHNPMNPPVPYKRRFRARKAGKRLDPRKVKRMADNPLRHYTQDIPLNDEELADLIGLYDGGLAYVDGRVGEIVDTLKGLGLYDRTLVVVTADHGEHFGEHGHFSHVSSLYQPIVHVPLIMKPPGRSDGGKRTEKRAQIVDIFPTCCEAAGVAPDRYAGVSGKSLLGSVTAGSEDKTVICEWEGRVPYFILHQLNCDVEDPRVQRFRTKIWAVLKGDLKYLAWSDGPEELYNLRNDPEETDNLISSLPQERERLSRCLAEWRRGVEPRAKAAQPIDQDEEIRKNLKALGYI